MKFRAEKLLLLRIKNVLDKGRDLLFTLCTINSLERCSYTIKSGQYLSWDSRSKKVQEANAERIQKGQKLLPEYQCWEIIENVKKAITEELEHVFSDISTIQVNSKVCEGAKINFIQKSVLFDLPSVDSEIFKGVITSPPYCNRYDYTRTYALELVYLGLTEDTIKEMRQALLSCTVESRSKIEALRDYYKSIGAGERFEFIKNTIQSNIAFCEILTAMKARKEN